MKKYADKVNYIFVAVYVALFLCCYLTQNIYGVMTKYASLITFLILSLMALIYFERIDKEVLIVAFGCIIAGVNLVYLKSNKGAFLTAADLLLMLYLAGKVKFDKKSKLIMTGIGAALLLVWYSTVRWDYNFNMAGLVFMITCMLTISFLELIKDKYPYVKYVQVLSYIVALLFTILYHSRCAMMGMLIFAILYLLSPVIIANKWIRYTLIFLATLGSILFTLFYIRISHTGWNLTILYKDVLSGRQLIWEELWHELMNRPLTGVGSSYQLKSFFIFEVHNGLFDILAVHGVVVFICVITLLIKRLNEFCIRLNNENMSKVALAAVFAILFTSFFENFFIVSPYLLVVFLFMDFVE